MERCNKDGCCEHLWKRIGDGGKGFKAIHTAKAGDSEVRFMGVAYKESSKDNGLLLNWCPFCGGQPGYFDRSGAPTDEELRTIWRTNGGSFHGPNIETGTMPEAQLLPLLRSLMAPNARLTGPQREDHHD